MKQKEDKWMRFPNITNMNGFKPNKLLNLFWKLLKTSVLITVFYQICTRFNLN